MERKKIRTNKIQYRRCGEIIESTSVCGKENPRTIMGWCGLDGSRNPEEPEIFILLDEAYRNKGYGTQCVRELLRTAAEDTGSDPGNETAYFNLQWGERLMLIRIGDFDITECWDGVFYKKLSRYPEITAWEIQNVLDFIRYEKENGRTCEIEADREIINAIDSYMQTYDRNIRISPPKKIEECTACPKYRGCMTDYVCHTSPAENAIKILECGSLLSPVLARKMSAAELQKEGRNAANDPEDYFDYIMFAWGNCQAGDRLVMERKLGRFPDDKDLSTGFTPGIRFFFRYNRLIQHPDVVFEGVLPLKIRNELVLKDWVEAIIVPDNWRKKLEPYVSEELKPKMHYLRNNGKDIWEWSEMVYEYVRGTVG